MNAVLHGGRLSLPKGEGEGAGLLANRQSVDFRSITFFDLACFTRSRQTTNTSSCGFTRGGDASELDYKARLRVRVAESYGDVKFIIPMIAKAETFQFDAIDD